MGEKFELAKKPVWFLCNKDSETFTISVVKTQHPFRFYRGKPELIHYSLDIEFFDEHLMFDRVDDSPTTEDQIIDFESETKTDVPEEVPSPVRVYDKEELQNMRKVDLRELLEKLSPGKTCPVN